MCDELDFVKTSVKIKQSQVKDITESILATQKGVCPLCKQVIPKGMACLDHDHTTGEIRGVLCRNCNGMEGRIHNRVVMAKRQLTCIEWLENLLKYWKHHQISRHHLLHHTFKTEDEKRLQRNARARARRAAAKKKD